MKSKYLFFLIIFFSTVTIVSAQTKFSRLFWQNLGEIFTTTAIGEIAGGGYVIGGTVKDSATGSATDIFIAKFNSIGDSLWTRRIAANGSEVVKDIRQTSDGGFVITGSSTSFGIGYNDLMLLKTDSLGIVSWAKVYGDIYDDIGYSVRQNADSGYVIAGTSSLKAFVIRTNSLGDTLWTLKFLLDYGSQATAAEETASGEFIVAASADSVANSQYVVLMKLSSSGTILWTKKVDTYGNPNQTTYGLRQTIDGGYLVVAQQYIGFSTPLIFKFDSSGNMVFGRSFNLLPGSYLYMIEATQQPDLSHVMITSLYWPGVEKSTFIIKLNQAGDTLWAKKLENTLFGFHGTFTSDGGFASLDYLGGIDKIDSSYSMECNSPIPNLIVTDTFYIPSTSTPLISGGATITNATFTNANDVPRRLYTPCTPNVPTCVVTVDSTTQKNLVVWEENFDTTFIDSYQVYKESAAAGIYNLIGSVPHNQLSTFLDTASNPAAQSDRYRVSALWHTYYEPPNTVTGHKTIHLLVSPGLPPTMNLSWSSYEGFTYSTYNIWRGNGITSSIISSLPFGTNNFTDLNPPPGDSLYYVEVVHAPCNPTFRFGNGGGNSVFSSYNGTISNRFNTSLYFVGVNDNESNSGISLSPVPAGNELLITPWNFPVKSAIIISTLGQQMTEYMFENPSRDQIQLDISTLSPGVYSLQVFGNDHKKITKIFVKR